MALTDAAVKALKPNRGRYMRGDGRGLYIEVLPSGEKSWIYRYRLNRKPGKIVLGRYPEMTLQQARDEKNDQRNLVRVGQSPTMARRLARTGGAADPTLREFGEIFYRDYVEKRWKDPSGIRRYLDNDIYPALGAMRLKEIGVLDVQSLVHRRRDNGHVATALRIRNVIAWIFEYAIAKNLVATNPAKMVATKFIGATRARNRNLSQQEIYEFLSVIYRSNIRRQFKLALHIYLLTAVRKSELLLARWKDIDFETGEWVIPASTRKVPRDHVVYLSRQVSAKLRELKSLAGTSELVLPGRKSPKKPFAKNALNKALDGLSFEMEASTIHDSRRTAATQLAEMGYRTEVIEKALGHEKKGIVGVYNRAEYAPERREMLQAWADFVDGIVTESAVLIEDCGSVQDRLAPTEPAAA